MCFFVCDACLTEQVEVLSMPKKERDAYVDFEKGVQKDFCKVRYRLRNMNGSHTMEVLTLLSKFRQVTICLYIYERLLLCVCWSVAV